MQHNSVVTARDNRRLLKRIAHESELFGHEKKAHLPAPPAPAWAGLSWPMAEPSFRVKSAKYAYAFRYKCSAFCRNMKVGASVGEKLFMLLFFFFLSRF
jgi:hypothetical protein